MARIYEIRVGSKSYMRLRDTVSGRRVQYLVDLDRFTERQWLEAHGKAVSLLPPEERRKASGKEIGAIVANYLILPKDLKKEADNFGIDASCFIKGGEESIADVFRSYLSSFCKPEINSRTAIVKARRQCEMLMEFLRSRGIEGYSMLGREAAEKYPAWRMGSRKDGREKATSADTVNKELLRLKAVIKHGIKFHGWKERYLLDGIRVRATTENTKAVRPFEMEEVKKIFEWLREYSEKLGDWHLHDMLLLALCSGLEAKALSLMTKDWFKLDLGILRVYDKLVSGVIDAKTQNRARDIPLCPTMRKLCERGYIFARAARTHRKSKKGGTTFAAWAESILRKAERETGVKDINLHRFRHTCATMRLSAGWQLVRVSRMLGHSTVNTTAKHYAEYDYSASGDGFEGMVQAYGEFVKWVDEGYF